MTDRLLQLANQPYINGTGRRCPNYNNLVINLLLVEANVRPAFMFQPIDYKDRAAAQALLAHLIDEFPPGTFQSASCNQGVIYANRNNGDFTEKVQSYKESDDHAILGEILGYPEPGAHECEGIRYGCSIEGPDDLQVYATVVTKDKSLGLVRSQFDTMAAFLKARLGVQLELDICRMPDVGSF